MTAPLPLRMVRQALRSLGLEVRRARPVSSANEGEGRMSMRAVVAQARRIGFTPATVLDIGAASGTFALACHEIFPEARYVVVEPLEEYGDALERLGRSIPDLHVVRSAVTQSAGTAKINVHEDLYGSSLYREHEGSVVDGRPREVSATSLDDLTSRLGAEGPMLLKVDVQGAELDVIAGGSVTLRATELAILEVSLFGFFVGGPQVVDVIDVMHGHGFVPYDVAGLLYRPLDGALAQMDLAFVHTDGLFRRRHEYATAAQRAVQDERFRTDLAARGVRTRRDVEEP